MDIENLCSSKVIFLICCSVRSRAIRKWNSHKTSSWVRGTWLSQLVTSFHIVTSLIRSFIQLVIQLIIHFLHLSLVKAFLKLQGKARKTANVWHLQGKVSAPSPIRRNSNAKWHQALRHERGRIRTRQRWQKVAYTGGELKVLILKLDDIRSMGRLEWLYRDSVAKFRTHFYQIITFLTIYYQHLHQHFIKLVKS